MQVILKKDVQNLGEAGDLVNVKDGYARNFLFPNNVAELATEGSLAARERNIARIKAKSEKLHQEALEKAEKIEAVELISLSAKAGESGKLFGTITTKKLAEELLNKTGIEVDRKSIILDNPINHVGSFVMTVKLSSKVKAKLNVEVSASETIKEYFGRIPAGDENDVKNRWNLLDYGDVVVHIMHFEQRETYALEKFWNHAFKLERDEWEEESKEFAKYE